MKIRREAATSFSSPSARSQGCAAAGSGSASQEARPASSATQPTTAPG